MLGEAAVLHLTPLLPPAKSFSISVFKNSIPTTSYSSHLDDCLENECSWFQVQLMKQDKWAGKWASSPKKVPVCNITSKKCHICKVQTLLYFYPKAVSFLEADPLGWCICESSFFFFNYRKCPPWPMWKVLVLDPVNTW